MLSPLERATILLESDLDAWIAFSADETVVVGKGKTYEAAVKMAEFAGEDDPVLIKTPQSWQPQVF